MDGGCYIKVDRDTHHELNNVDGNSCKLREILAQHGLPEVWISDNGPNFTTEEFETFMRKNGIVQISSDPYHPASNGLAERAV